MRRFFCLQMQKSLSPRIGVFDSGIGGMTVLKSLQQRLPEAHFVYYADSQNAPYGALDGGTLLAYSERIVQYLIRREVDLIVVACNTVTTEVIDQLRALYPLPFVGIEPAIKPATRGAQNKSIGVLATARTLQSKGYQRTRDEYAKSFKVIERPGIGLVEEIEKGVFDSPELIRLVQSFVDDFERHPIHTLVLGCTHYILIKPLFERLFATPVTLLDANEAVARRTQEIAKPAEEVFKRVECYTSGSTELLEAVVKHLDIAFVRSIEALTL